MHIWDFEIMKNKKLICKVDWTRNKLAWFSGRFRVLELKISGNISFEEYVIKLKKEGIEVIYGQW